MSSGNQTNIEKDVAERRITVTRDFNGSLEDVWAAWTERELLEQWWAPKPWRAETKDMNFSVGGHWIYAMVSPEGARHWSRMDYTAITPKTGFAIQNAFCDENGVVSDQMPRMTWQNTFSAIGEGTRVTVNIQFAKDADMKQLVEMGFEGGFTMALANLDDYLAAGFKLRKEMKTSSKARVATYLNFPGNTEEAFLFYKRVFRAEFTGKGLQRFSDVSLPDGVPPMSDEQKKLIIHAELTILGGHILMATDAPESMGFTLKYGDNMHINLEPETREETKRLFDELSDGGTVIMPLTDMFWGAYFGQFKDKYGVNWMVNHQPAN